MRVGTNGRNIPHSYLDSRVFAGESIREFSDVWRATPRGPAETLDPRAHLVSVHVQTQTSVISREENTSVRAAQKREQRGVSIERVSELVSSIEHRREIERNVVYGGRLGRREIRPRLPVICLAAPSEIIIIIISPSPSRISRSVGVVSSFSFKNRLGYDICKKTRDSDDTVILYCRILEATWNYYSVN